MPEYIVFVMPPYEPYEDAEPFDIPEWDFGAALDTANRYRERGWGAAVAGAADAPRCRRVWDPGSWMPPQAVLARSADCALAQGRREDPRACAVQPTGGE